jgi:phage terminase Nu1 subunit (DNA packaging protein)
MERKRNLISRKGFISQKKLAKLLGVTTRWVRDLEARGVLKKEFGKYDKDESVTAYISFLRGSKDKSLAEAQRIHLETKTKKLLLEAQKLEGSLVDKDEEQKKFEYAVRLCEENFRNFPAKLVPILVRIDKTEEKLMFQIIKYGVESCWRDLAGKTKPETPTIQPWEVELLRLGLIQPDANGEVFELSSSFPFRRKVKAIDLVAHLDRLNKSRGGIENEKKESGNPNGDQKIMVS